MLLADSLFGRAAFVVALYRRHRQDKGHRWPDQLHLPLDVAVGSTVSTAPDDALIMDLINAQNVVCWQRGRRVVVCCVVLWRKGSNQREKQRIGAQIQNTGLMLWRAWHGRHYLPTSSNKKIITLTHPDRATDNSWIEVDQNKRARSNFFFVIACGWYRFHSL